MKPIVQPPSGEKVRRPTLTPPVRGRLRRTGGSVILLVLVTVLLASFLLGKFVERAGTEMLADSRADTQARLRREAYSSLEVVLAVLADMQAIDQGLHSSEQGWGDPFEYAGYEPEKGLRVDLNIEDESGRMSLPKADAGKLTALLKALGAGPAQAERAANALMVWIKSDYVPTSGDTGADKYDQAPIPYNPAQRPLRSFAELASVYGVKDLFYDDNGRPTRMAREFARDVSLYSFDSVNINAANPEVQAAGGLDVGAIGALKDFTARQRKAGGQGYFKAMSEANAAMGANTQLQGFGTDVKALRITVAVHDGASVFRLSAVIAPPGGASFAPTPPPADPKAAAPAPAAPVAPPAAPAQTAGSPLKKLDYPFKVLEVREDIESTANPEPDQPEHA